MIKNIVLFGFMGTGKTTVAKELAARLSLKFVEMDTMIEQQEGLSINEIFAAKGESYFRKQEAEIAKDLGEREGLVISAGGGIVLQRENIRSLAKNGILICLQATPEEIYRRVAGETHRPLLQVADPLGKIRELLAQRQHHYALIRHQVDTTGKKPLQVVMDILNILNPDYS